MTKLKAAKSLQDAINYLYGTPISKKALTDAVAILKTVRVGAKRGYLYPADITKLAKLTRTVAAKRKAAA